jgi:hypothetical protein
MRGLQASTMPAHDKGQSHWRRWIVRSQSWIEDRSQRIDGRLKMLRPIVQ